MPVPRTTNNNVNDMDNPGGGPLDWFRALPFVTQNWFGATLLMTVAGNMGIVSPMSLVFIWESVKTKFEIWRCLTCFCYAGPFKFPTLILLYLCYNFSNMYETNTPFNTGAGGGTADYLFMWMLGAVTMIATQPLLEKMGVPVSSYLFTSNMVYMVLYVWSKRHPTTSVSIWGFPVKGMMLPFVYVGLAIFTAAPYFDMIHGILIGHIYYFIVDVVPQAYGKELLRTPQFLIDRLGAGIYIPGNPPQQQQQTGAAAAPRSNWGGGGQRLGTTSGGGGGAARSNPPVNRTTTTTPAQQAQQQPTQPTTTSTGRYSWGGGQKLGSD